MIIQADSLKPFPLADQSIDCVVTSPPYWGLRDYGVDGQLGLEPTPEEYVQRLVGAFRKVSRVLKKDGTVWLNLGDTMVAKNLVGIPWRVAFALQSDGWYLRSDIIWQKTNPMPESVKDRPTRSHEYIFLLSKAERYYYDHEAIREPAIGADRVRADRIGGNKHNAETTKHSDGSMFIQNQKPDKQRGHGRRHDGFNDRWDHMTKAEQGENGRNKRDVWTVATRPNPVAHFATFPPALIKPCILAGCPVGGIVLDPFAGTGTTVHVARELGRCGVGLELSAEYCAMGMDQMDGQIALPLEVEA